MSIAVKPPESSPSVRIVGDVRLRFGCSRIEVEEPVELRAGLYDVERIGAFTFLGGENSVVRHVNSIGRFCMIGPGCQIGLVQHPAAHLSAHVIFEHNSIRQFPAEQTRRYWEMNKDLVEQAKAHGSNGARQAKITIGNDVWIGQGATIMRGCTIGDGAIIGAGAIVTKDVPPYAIVAGSPAKVMKWRFEERYRTELLELQWWRYDLEVMDGVDVTDIGSGIDRIKRNILQGARVNSPRVSTIE